MKDINLDCRKQISAASLWRDNLYEIKQLVLDLSTSRTEIRAKIYANLGCKKDEKFKIIIFRFIKINFSQRQYLITSKIVLNFV